MSSAPSVPGIEVGAPWLGGCEHVLTAGTLELLATLNRTFGPRRTELTESHAVRDAELAGGRCPVSWPGTKDMRQGDWQVAPLAPGLVDRRVEITGPDDRKMVVNALKCDAKVCMADYGVGHDEKLTMPAQFRPEDLDTMPPGCCALGPDNLANPGKVVPTPRPCGEGPRPRTAAGDTRDPAIGQVFSMPVLTVVPVGVGTQTGWAAPPTSCDIVLDTTGRVVGHPAGDLVIVTEAVVRLQALQAPVGQPGQVLALEPPEQSATLGGLVSANTSGARRRRYSAAGDPLIDVADGTTARAGGELVTNLAGYHLGRLCTGARGSPGVPVSTAWRLHPLSPARGAVVVPVAGAAEIKEYGDQLRDEPGRAGRGEALAAKVRDVTEPRELTGTEICCGGRAQPAPPRACARARRAQDQGRLGHGRAAHGHGQPRLLDAGGTTLARMGEPMPIAHIVQVLDASIQAVPVGRHLADALDGPGTSFWYSTRTALRPANPLQEGVRRCSPSTGRSMIRSAARSGCPRSWRRCLWSRCSCCSGSCGCVRGWHRSSGLPSP